MLQRRRGSASRFLGRAFAIATVGTVVAAGLLVRTGLVDTDATRPEPSRDAVGAAGLILRPPARHDASAYPTPTPTPSPTPTPTPSPSPTPTPAPSPTPTPTPDLSWHIPVLTYHLVATATEAGDALASLVVSPDLFSRQMATLHAAGWHTITSAELAAALASGHRPPRKTFVITIDDGYVVGFTEAFPVLQANGFRATYFIPTGRIGWARILTPDQLTTMAAAGMEIADHTVDHVNLTSLSNTAAMAEIVGAADSIENLLGARPSTLAYPFGASSTTVRNDVNVAGFALAYITGNACRETYASRFAIPRYSVGPTELPSWLLALVRSCNG